jgi:inosine-uridine nucleoside N-ribohydrolase
MTKTVIRALILVVLAGMGTATAAAQARVPVWIDTDPALGEPERDVDDGFALVQAFNSPELDLRGVSVVFGNVPLDRGLPIARRLVREFGPRGLQVFAGAADAAQLGTDMEASRAMAAALRNGPLTILALGPATNVATVVKRHPELATRIVRIVAVAGRRPGQRFTTGTANTKGHRDFNFEMDQAAFRVLLESKTPLVLTPFEISSKVWIEASDLDRLAMGGTAAKALEPPARQWLDLWRRLFAVNGFNPFDTLAVGYVTSPARFQCEMLSITIETLPDDLTEPGVQGTKVEPKPYLLVSSSIANAFGQVTYCATAPPTFKTDLLERLLR